MASPALEVVLRQCKGCRFFCRTPSSILRDIEQVPRVANVLVVAPQATREAFEKALCASASRKLTRLQAELNGYCYACAYKLEQFSDQVDAAEEGARHD